MIDYPMVRIEWTDACSPSLGWRTEEQIEEPAGLVTSVGFLIKETDKFVTLAASVAQFHEDTPAQFGEIIHIMAGSIRSIKRLRPR